MLGTQIRKSHAGHTYCTLELRRPRRIVDSRANHVCVIVSRTACFDLAILIQA